MQPHPTLDQLQVFLTVAEQRSFSGAARVLHRTQSVISYTISNLETQLGVALFFRSAAKRPQLTEAGKSVLEDARRMLCNLDLLRSRVAALNEGLEAELSVATSGIVPSEILVQVLQAFRRQFPTVSLNVTVGTLGIVVDALANGKVTVGFGGVMSTPNDRLVFDRVGQSAMIPVAAPSHPLAAQARTLTHADVRDHTQLIVYDASGMTKGRDFNVFSIKTWRVSDNATKLLFIRGGLGWGGLPASVVQSDLASGHLVCLQFPAFEQGEYPIYAIHNTVHPPGPAARWMISEFRNRFSNPGLL